MMRLLLINTNRYLQPTPIIPIGVCMIAESAHRLGHQVSVLDLSFAGDVFKEIGKQLDSFNPDIVGFSMRNVDNIDYQNSISFLSEIESMIGYVRSKLRAPIVLGGSGATLAPREVSARLHPDYLFCGSGDVHLNELLNRIETDLQHSHGNSTPQIVHTPHAAPDMSFYPDMFRWIDSRKYRRFGATIPIQTKRGCAYNCTYCTYPTIEGNRYLLATPDDVTNALERLIPDGYQDFEFVDNVFNAPYDHALEICESIRRKDIRARFTAMDIHPGELDHTLLSAMAGAGFCGMGVTAESAADCVLEGLGKDFRQADLIRAANQIREYPIPCCWIFLVGGPGETLRTLDETIQFVKNKIRPTDLIFFTIGIRLYPGTALDRSNASLDVPEGADSLETRFFLNEDLDIEQAIEKIAVLAQECPNVIDSSSISAPVIRYIHYAACLFGLHPPLWRYTYRLKRFVRLAGVRI